MLSLNDFDFDLPEELIAQVPLEDRAASRMLVLPRSEGPARHRGFCDIVDELDAGDLLVLNDTKVTALRLFGKKVESGGLVEALLLSESSEPSSYVALVKPAKRLQVGARVDFEGGILATITATLPDGHRVLRFAEGADTDLQAAGRTPLPPYIRASLADQSRYQTVYAENPGSAAAPTAGLHFTPSVFQALEAKGVTRTFVTLDVGIDTFRPVTVSNLDQHQMHGERCSISEQSAEHIQGCRGRIIAVGTTTVRTLESMAIGQRHVNAGDLVTQKFITPGYDFRVVDGMLTNFHLPKTTMLCMVAALSSRDRLMAAYQEAIELRYRFLSFGDCMLVIDR
jgi:S-adenosylmethionine:tRNA ribosyltransferase-isomerase